MSAETIAALIQLFAPLLFLCVPCGLLSRNLARKKGYTGYFWTGFFLLVLGLIYVAGLPDNRDK